MVGYPSMPGIGVPTPPPPFLEFIKVDWFLVVLLSLGAYLLGSIPFAYILVYRVKGIDIRQVGSRNVGALNTLHQMGVAGGVVVLLSDVGKGAMAVLLPGWVGAPEWTPFLAGSLVVIGHNWPIYLGFRGGKGVASLLGVSLALLPVLTLIVAGPAMLIVLLTRNVIIGVVLGFILLNTLTVVTDQGAGQISLCVSLTSLVTATYVVGSWGQIITAIRTRHWRGLFYGTRLTPEE